MSTPRIAIPRRFAAPPSVPALRAALRALLWRDVADGSSCTCVRADPCDLCQAMGALGLGRWVNSVDAQRRLAAEVDDARRPIVRERGRRG